MNPTRILVADDEAIILTQLEESLRDMGYDVVAKANNGADAIAKAREARPDIVLMDIVMPGEIDGIAACVTIQDDMQIPVVLLTAHGGDEIVSRAKTVRPSGYLLKPHRPHQLKACIETSLSHLGRDRHRASLLRGARHRSEERHRSISDTHQLVADDLTMVLALMQLQTRHSGQISLDVAMDSVSKRVLSIMSLQESLYAGYAGGELDAMSYFRDTIEAVRNSHCIPERVRVHLTGDEFNLAPERLQRLGLIVTELVVNAARHAFGDEGGRILVSLKDRGEAGLLVVVSDDGNGFPEQPVYRNAETIGLDVVHRQVRILGGTITQHPGQGTAYTITLPRPEAGLSAA